MYKFGTHISFISKFFPIWQKYFSLPVGVADGLFAIPFDPLNGAISENALFLTRLKNGLECSIREPINIKLDII